MVDNGNENDIDIGQADEEEIVKEIEDMEVEKGQKTTIEDESRQKETFKGECHNCGLRGHKAWQCKSGKRSTKFRGKCHNCGLTGHKARECKQPKKRVQSKRKCFNCGRLGHIAHQCKYQKMKPALKYILKNCTNCTMNITGATLPNKD
ncbi:cellular nucleic acid-binding protein-like isoform X2 [Dendronephthya gigantea]|uniref:cellular nucleic acid-binding protein-like isoform X2 n=1 Tax=Dendronephthya gigantea TaxID=151771 RepID=UPI00106B3D58|nr:cellular nucleic acid-binding protein-like isoform X2 [Dendronephthya gigantea]